MKQSVAFQSSGLAAVIVALLLSGPSQAREADTALGKRLDLNTATASQLESLPGISSTTARKIVAGRPYKSIDDLTKAGVTNATLRRISSSVTVNSSTAQFPSKDIKQEGKQPKSTEKGNDAKSKLVDLNSAKQATLEEVPGVGPAYAKKIVAGRPYKSIDDLAKAGIPSSTIRKIRSLVTVSGEQRPYKVAKPVTDDAANARTDLNSAKESELEEVPGIGSAYAKKIVAGRPYKSVDDLSKAGIPAATIAKIRPLVSIGRTAEAPPRKGMVWANLDTKTYHKEDSRWYGKTKNGKYMSEADAIKEGYRASKR